MASVIALGELLIDFTSASTDNEGYPTMVAHPGGAPANFLAALAKFGDEVGFIGKVGDDTFGHLLEGTLKKAGISTEGLIIDKNFFTTLAFVTLDESGDREFSFARKPGADTRLTEEELNYSLIEAAKVFHFGTLSLTNEPSRATTKKAVSFAKEKGLLISFDPNLRKPLWNNLEAAKEEMLWGLKNADIVKISDDEIDFLFGLSPKEGAEKVFNDFGAKLVFVTCGADGAWYKNEKALGHVDGIKGIQVVDTTGAGDIFGGSAMHMILEKGKNLGDLEEKDLQEIVRFACTSASLSTCKAGGISSVPDLVQIMDKM